MAELQMEQLSDLYDKLKEANVKLKSKIPSRASSTNELINQDLNHHKHTKEEAQEKFNRESFEQGEQQYQKFQNRQAELAEQQEQGKRQQVDIARDIMTAQDSIHGTSFSSTTKRFHFEGFDQAPAIQEKFYNRGKEIAVEKQLLEEKTINDIKKLANSKKMTEGSYKIIIKKIENVLSTALMDSDPEGNKRITFEQFGRVLTLLGIFRVIYYNEEFEVENVDLFYQNQNKDQNRRYSEMMIHEQLWNLCADHPEDDTLDTEIVYIVLRILLDPASLPPKEVAKLLNEYLQKFEQENKNHDTKAENNNPQNEDEEYEKWPVEVLVKKFRALNDNRLAFLKTGYLKYEKFDDIYEQNKKHTFKPAISELSYAIERYHTDRFLKENPIENLDSNSLVGSRFKSTTNNDQVNKKLFGVQDNSQFLTEQEKKKQRESEVNNRIQILYKKKELNKKWKEDQQKQKEAENLRECTFQPNVKYFKHQTQRDENPFDRLYNHNKTQNKKEEQRLMEQIEKETQELEQCTFKPEINPNPSILSPKYAPKGYSKAISRIRQATETNIKRKEVREKIPSGENYEKIKNAQIQPFTFTTNPRQKRQPPFVYIDANVGPGKSGRIGIHEDDDPKILAQNFAISFQLSQEMQDSLEDLISRQLQEHFAKKQGEY